MKKFLTATLFCLCLTATIVRAEGDMGIGGDAPPPPPDCTINVCPNSATESSLEADQDADPSSLIVVLSELFSLLPH